MPSRRRNHFVCLIVAVICSAIAGCLVPSNIDPQSRLQEGEPPAAPAAGKLPKHFRHVLIVVLENKDLKEALENDVLKKYADKGVLFTNFHGLYHPSQPNYFAMIGGRDFEAPFLDADGKIDLPTRRGGSDTTIGDFLTWRNYAEGYPSGPHYARKHVPFASFKRYQGSSNIVGVPADANDPSHRFFLDAADPQKFPQYAFYSPDMINDAHDSKLPVATAWLSVFLERFEKTAVAADTLVVITFDESADHFERNNHIYTVFFGPMVKSGLSIDLPYNHYNVLRTIEDNFGIPPFAQGDRAARIITDQIWK